MTALRLPHKEQREVADALLADGWSFDHVSGTTHYVYRYPTTGETVTIPGTPSDHRWRANLLADVRRVTGRDLFGKPNAGRYTRTDRSSGFSLAAARREALDERPGDAELIELHEVLDELAGCNPRRDQARCRELAARHHELSQELARLGLAHAMPEPPTTNTTQELTA